MDKQGKWKLSPAYDLCYSYTPGGKWTNSHQLSLNGKQDNFTMADLQKVGENMGIREHKQIIEEVQETVSHWHEIAKDCEAKPEHADFSEKVKAASKKHNIKVTTVVGVPGSHCVWNFRQGPATIGLVPKEERAEKIKVYHEMIDFCAMAEIPAMHSHFGFIPEDPSSEQYKDFIKVMQDLANYAKQRGVMIYFETGQETPTTLIRAIKDIATGNVFINCDLANLLMYGKANSLDAVKQFGSLIKEFHAKDGRYPDPNNPYELGAEVPIPTGEVNFPAVIAELKKQGFQGALTIECELNGARHDYVIKTREYLQGLLDN